MFVNQLPPDGSSAFFRALHPKSWWWTPMFDMVAALLQAMQSGNWQRGGGKGPRPKLLQRPKEKARSKVRGLDPTSAEELAEKKQRMRERRRVVTGGD